MKNKAKAMDKDTLIHSEEQFDVIINYSDEAKEKELFKFTVKTEDKTFEIEADKILEMIAQNFKQKELAVALMDTEQNVVPAVEAFVPVHFKADKDYKKGQVVQFKMPLVLPYFLATVMEAYKLAIVDKTRPVIQVAQETYEQANKAFEETNKKFVEKFWKKEIEIMNKSADTAKADVNKAD